MINSIRRYIEQNSLFNQGDKLLLTVSGGIDSMVCLHVLHCLEYNIGIAHCNFHLRGAESDGDEELVQNTAQELGVAYHRIDFKTAQFAKDHGYSIQMAARELRYDWFEKIRQEFDYKYIVVAHHLDDSVETILINLTRGTGLAGLTGISSSKGYIKRPLLSISREQILEYAGANRINYREDSSNSKTKYSRNRIRHNVIPELESINPSLKKSFLSTISNLSQEKEVLAQLFEELKPGIISESNKGISIDIQALTDSRYRNWFLYRFLDNYGFSKQQIDNINDSLDHKVGLQFYAPACLLTIDRKYAFISTVSLNSDQQYEIASEDTSIDRPLRLELTFHERKMVSLSEDSNTAFLDADTLTFPLTLSHWKSGDSFQPLGMPNFQKLSDFFINSKIPRHQKDSVWILRSNDEIVWIVGHRIDHRNRIQNQTKKVYQITILD